MTTCLLLMSMGHMILIAVLYLLIVDAATALANYDVSVDGQSSTVKI